MESNSDVLEETTCQNPSFMLKLLLGNQCFGTTRGNGDTKKMQGFASSKLGRFLDDNKEFT